jgi:hypothetical protein
MSEEMPTRPAMSQPMECRHFVQCAMCGWTWGSTSLALRKGGTATARPRKGSAVWPSAGSATTTQHA